MMPGHRITPTIWVAPVRSHCSPITTSLCCAGAEPAIQARAAATAASAKVPVVIRVMAIFPRCRTSIRERPDPKVCHDVAPQPAEPFRLECQEYDDQRTKHHQAQVRNDIRQIG